jgi:hypothetical protein
MHKGRGANERVGGMGLVRGTEKDREFYNALSRLAGTKLSALIWSDNRLRDKLRRESNVVEKIAQRIK